MASIAEFKKMFLFNKKSTKKLITIYIIVFLVLFSSAGILKPKPARALFGVGDVSVTIGDIPRTIYEIISKIVKQTTAVAWKNALKTFLGKIAYDTATYIATGEHGSKSLFHQDTWKDYLDEVKDEVIGEMITEMFSGRGHCSITTHKSCRTDADCPVKTGQTAQAERVELDALARDYAEVIRDAESEAEVKELQAMHKEDIAMVHAQYRERCEGTWSGFDVCEPGGGGIAGTLLKTQILVGIGRELQYKRPRCDWNRIREAQGQTWNNLQTFFNSLQKWDDYKHTLTGMFKPQQSDFGIWFITQSSIKDLQTRTEIAAREQRQEGGGFKPKTDLVTGKIRTPASILEGTLQSAISQAGIAETSFTGELIADTINIFTNTLMHKWLRKIFEQGLVTEEKVVKTYSFGYSLGGEAAAGLQYLDFLRPDYVVGGLTNILNELVCPAGGVAEAEKKSLGQNRCVIDENFRIAIENKMTVKEAIAAGRIDGRRIVGFYIGPGGISGGNATELEDRNIFSYRSLLILRKYRIIPVGWELAANYIRRFMRREELAEVSEMGGVTLNMLIDNYSNPNSPFYHLVDPNWILKAPEVFVRRKGPGEQLEYRQVIPETGEVIIKRANYNADEQNCVYEKPDGTCGHWGYCIEEKPSWKFGAGSEACLATYRSCFNFIPDYDQSARTPYLYDTVDKNGCDLSNYGCRAYCADWRVVNNSWQWDCDVDTSGTDWIYGYGVVDNLNIDDVGYYSRSAGSLECSQADDGCHEYVQLTHLDGSLLSQTEWSNLGNVTTGAYLDQGYLDNNIYLKLAPDYYNCQDYTSVVSTDRTACPEPNTLQADDRFWRDDIQACVGSGVAECANYALYCQAEDALCEYYTPVSTNEVAVPAVIRHRVCDAAGPNYSRLCDDLEVDIWNDECPAACVGYEGYYKPATPFEAEEVDDPSSNAYLRLMASTATACTQVDCDEFTNLDEVARGGEGIEYFSYLRQCIKPGTAGYIEGTFYTWEGSDTTGYQLKRWELVVTGGAPATTDGSTTCDPLDPDCREFFSISGSAITAYLRYFSKTITISEDCHPYRRTLAETDGGAWCASHAGRLDNDGHCVYMAIPNQGIGCAAVNAGCREYKSPGSYNYQVILQDDFEDGELDDWYDGANPPVISREAAKKDYYSMYVNMEAAINLPPGSLHAGSNYRLIVVAKGPTGGIIGAQFEGQDGNIRFRQENLTTGAWFRYELNLEDTQGIARDQSANEALRLFGNFYLDEIILREADSEMLIKNSWTTPAVCGHYMGLDSLHSSYWIGSQPVGVEMLGCEAYQDSDGQTWNLRSFDRVCREELVGCQALIDTQNTLTLADDDIQYLVYQDSQACLAEAKGCSRLGLIEVEFDAEPTSATFNSHIYQIETVYRKIDPDNQQIVCAGSAGQASEFVNCEKYTVTGEAAVYNFKNPFDRVCQWKTSEPYVAVYGQPSNLNVYNISTTTWFLIDTQVVCPESAFCDLEQTDNPDGCLTKNCPISESGCQEYIDPTQPEGCVEGTYPNWNLDKCDHYYYKRVEEGGCNQIDPLNGCVGFYNYLRGAPTMLSNCQPGCPYVDETTYYTQDCRIVSDPSQGKPGCGILTRN